MGRRRDGFDQSSILVIFDSLGCCAAAERTGIQGRLRTARSTRSLLAAFRSMNQ